MKSMGQRAWYEPKIEKCEDCDDDGNDKPAVQQLCGRWLCQHHLDEWLDKGAHVLLAVQKVRKT